MEKYNYREAMKADIREWLQNNQDEYKDVPESHLYDTLNDLMWEDDDVTGNTSFYDSEYKCEEYLCHNFDLLFEALSEFHISAIRDYSTIYILESNPLKI